MADNQTDAWEKFAPQPAKAPTVEEKPAAAASAPDAWEKFSPAAKYDDLAQIPNGVKSRLLNGQALGHIAEGQGVQQDSSFHAIWDDVKQGATRGYDAEGLANTFQKQREDINKFTGPNGDKFGGWSMLETGVEAAENFYHVLKGAYVGGQTGLSVAVARAAGPYGNPNAAKDTIEAVTRPYSPDIPSIADLAAQTMAFEIPPAIVGPRGTMARLGRTEDGRLTATPVGQMPVERDFQMAAADISTPASRPAAEKNVKAQWDTYGMHPNEIRDIAAESPTHAADLNSAATPVLPLPERPSKTYLKEVDDNFFKLRMAKQADYSEMKGRLDNMGPSITPELDTKLYRFMEGDKTVRLTPEEGKFFNEHVLPLKKEELELYEKMRKADLPVEEYDPTYMHRMVVGKSPELDRLAGEGSQAIPQINPNTGVIGQGLMNRNASALNPRTYWAVEAEDGSRRLVKMTNDGRSIRSVDGKTSKTGAMGLDLTEDKFKPGESYTIDGKSWKLVNALTSEIEANTGLKYYKSGIANTVDNLLHLRSAERALYRIQQMRDTPEWNAYTVRGGQWKSDWISPDMPVFRNDVMDPKIAHIINDFYGTKDKGAVLDMMERVNNFAITSLFWTPVPHAMNAAAFWTMDRAWENFTPKGMASLFSNGAKAIREVVVQGKEYQEAMRAGGSFQYAPIANREFYPSMLKQLGQQIEKHPEGWDGLAKIIGMKPIELTAAFYNSSNKILWAASDMFKMQRILELKQLKGMTTEEAVKHTEQYTPAYRIPSEIFGDRTLRQVYANPILFEFSRYHYDIMKSYANMAKDLAVGDMEQKSRAVGSLLALGGLQLVVWPAMSWMLQQATGNEEWRVPSFGPGRITEPLWGALVHNTPGWPKFIQDYYGDTNKTFLDAMRGLIPMSPGATMLTEMYNNRYNFSGRNIAEPSDVRNERWGRVAGQEIEHAGRTLVEPYNIFADAWKHDEGPGHVLLKHIFGLQDPTMEKEQSREKAFRFQNRAAQTRTRENKAMGPLEHWITESPLGGIGD